MMIIMIALMNTKIVKMNLRMNWIESKLRDLL